MPDAQGSSTVPPPPTDSPDLTGSGSGGGMDRIRGIISKLSGGGTPLIDQKLAEHHQKRAAEAGLYQENAKRLAGLLARANASKSEKAPFGINPVTGQPATQEDVQKWQQQFDVAWGSYSKIAGQSKEAKPIIQQMGGLLKHITGHHGAGEKPGAGGQPQGGGGAAAPPSAPAAPAAQGSQTVAPPPQGDAAAAAPKPTVPPPPGAAESSPMPAAWAGQAEDEMMHRQETIHDKAAGLEADETAKITGMAKGLKDAGFTDDQVKEIIKSKAGGVGMRTRMHPVKVQDPNGPPGQTVPALQDSMSGEVFGPDGQAIENPYIFPTSLLPTIHTGEVPVFNPDTGQFEMKPTHTESHKGTPGGGGGKPAAPSAARPPSAGTGSGKGSSAASGGKNFIPARQFNILQKQATAIDEARNSLVGPDPSKGAGGLAADLDVFKSPESIKKISEYLGLVNSQIANEAKSVAGQGAWAAAEWYVGLPQAVVSLQQGALADASRSLNPKEQRFVADYYRTMGTIGGMRAATGASSAQWSYNTLRSELPTPGPVTSYNEAARRVNNFVQETNVVAKRNPLLHPSDTPSGASRSSTVPSPPGAGSGKAVSLAAAKQLPKNKGKSDAEIRKDIEAHGHKVVD